MQVVMAIMVCCEIKNRKKIGERSLQTVVTISKKLQRLKTLPSIARTLEQATVRWCVFVKVAPSDTYVLCLSSMMRNKKDQKPI